MRKKSRPDKWEVFSHGGRKATGLDAVEWAKKAVALGAGEIVLNSIDADGTKAGFDLVDHAPRQRIRRRAGRRQRRRGHTRTHGRSFARRQSRRRAGREHFSFWRITPSAM